MGHVGFPQRLVSLRNEKELSQYDLAEFMDVTRGTVGNYEQGTRNPDLQTLEWLADFFGVSVDYILGRTNKRGTGPNRNFFYGGKTYNLEQLVDKGKTKTIDDKPISKRDREKLKGHIKEGIRKIKCQG